MKVKTLFVLLAVLLVLCLTVWYLQSTEDRAGDQKKMGRQIFKDLPVNEITYIALRGPTSSVTLRKTDSGWTVSERWNYPADFLIISDFVRKIRDIKVGREFALSDEVSARLALKDPTDSKASETHKGIRLDLEKAQGILLESLLIGKERVAEPSAGQTAPTRYITRRGDSFAYLVDWPIAGPSTEPSAWLKKDLLNIREEDIASIMCTGENGKDVRYHFVRPEKGRPFEVRVPKGEARLKTSELDRLSHTLTSLRLSDISGPFDPGNKPTDFDRSVWIEFRLFDGFIYRVYPGAGCNAETCKLMVEADFQKEGSLSPTAKNGETQKNLEDGKREAAQINERLSRWVYLVPSWQEAVFATKQEAFFEKEEKKEDKRPADKPSSRGRN